MSDAPDIPTQRIPQEHYAAIGKVAAGWAMLEFQIDNLVWGLIGGYQPRLACVTAQMISIHPKLNALKSIVRLRGGSDATISAVNRFASDIGGLVEARNRAVHDPVMRNERTGEVMRLKITARGALSFDFVPETLADLGKTTERIKDAIERFGQLAVAIEAEIDSLPETPRPPFAELYPHH
jgi:hypothetical protein